MLDRIDFPIGYLSLAALLLGFAGFFIGCWVSRKQLNSVLINFEQAAVGIAQIAPDGRFIEVNSGLCHILGYSDRELCQLKFTDVTHPDRVEADLASVRSLVDNVITDFSRERRYLRKDGSIVWCQVSVSVVRDTSGKIEYLLAIVTDISDRKQIQTASQESQERFRNLIETSSDWVWEVDENAVYTYASPKVRELLGYEPEEIIGKTPFDLMPESEARRVLGIFTDIAEQRKPFQCLENANYHKDGRLIVLETSGVPIFDAGDVFRGYRGIDRDVTQRKQTERLLQDSETRNRAIIEALPDLMLRVRRDGFCLDCMFPKTIDAGNFLPIEKYLSEILPPALLQRQLQAIARALTTEEVQLYEHQLEKYDSTAYEEVRIAPLNAEEVLILVRDISDRKRSELALQESEERLQQIVNSMSDGLLVVDCYARIEYVNPAAESLFGLPKSELLGSVFGFPAIVGEVAQICIQHSSDRRSVAEMRVGEIVWEGTTVYLISLHDITERDRAEQALQESEEKYRRIVETATEGIWVLDRDNRTSFVNPQMAQMLGYSVEAMIGKSLFDFMDEEGLAIAQFYVERRRHGIQENHDFKFRCRDGANLWAIVSTNPLFDREGNYAGALGMVTDISDRKRIEQTLCENEQRLESILSSIQDAVWSASIENFEPLYLNLAAEKVFGRHANEFYANPLLWFKIVFREDRKYVRFHRQLLLETGAIEMEYRIVRPNGEIRWLYNRSNIVCDSLGNPIRIDGIDTDITERKQAEAKLERNAFYDSLTDLPNRALFCDRLEHAIARIERHPDCLFAVLFLDLDGFKLINDSLGHLTGDRLLQAFASRLSECLRPSDTLARLGGDEFTILLEDIKTTKDAIHVAQRIIQALTVPFDLDGQEIFTNTSIGIALSTADYQRSDEILRDADTAMYRAKAQGKGCYVVFDPQMYQTVVSRLQLETDLRQAINRQELRVFYQPIVSLETGRLMEFEALIRWQHAERGLISPADFIPIAEETGLIIPIGQWILKEACQQLRIWQDEFPHQFPLKISVNLSGKQLRSNKFIEQIDEILAETGLDASHLKLEITESSLIENVELATNILLELKKRQIELCLDDFGTGYSSLSYLRRFPVDTIKIDRSFIKQMQSEDDGSEIVRAIVTLAHVLGMTAVAEGIETKHQLEQLQQLACQKGQGYFFSKPLSQVDAEVLLQ